MLMLRMRVRLARLRNEDEDSVRFNFTIIHNNICFLHLYCHMIPIRYYVILTFFVLSGAQAVHPRHLCEHPQGWLQGSPD